MKSGQKNFLRGCFGDEGFDALIKTIQREGFSIPTEMQEQYLAMLVVPHSLLAWVNATAKKLPEKGSAEFEVPGNVGTKLLLNKIKSDIYSGYLHKDGEVLHRFTGLSIPQLAGHMMTVLEMYQDLDPEVSGHKKVVDGIAPLIEKLVQERVQVQPINITINVATPEAKPAAPGFITTPPVMTAPAAVPAEESTSVSEKKAEESVSAPKPLVTTTYKEEDTSESSSSSRKKTVRLPDGSGFFIGTVKSEDAEVNRITADVIERALQALKKEKRSKFGVTMTKNEMDVCCPDCGGREFENEKFVGCVCFEPLRDSNVKVVKNEDGTYRLQFGKGWDADSFKLLLDVIKRERHE